MGLGSRVGAAILSETLNGEKRLMFRFMAGATLSMTMAILNTIYGSQSNGDHYSVRK